MGNIYNRKIKFDNIEYNNESQITFYLNYKHNKLDMKLFEESLVYYVVGSVFFALIVKLYTFILDKR